MKTSNTLSLRLVQIVKWREILREKKVKVSGLVSRSHAHMSVTTSGTLHVYQTKTKPLKDLKLVLYP